MKILATVLLGATMLSATAHAETKDYYRSGSWKNYAGTSHNGHPLCGMATELGNGKSIHIKSDGDRVYLYAFKDTWRIPEGTTIQMKIGFDGGLWGGVENAGGDTHRGSGWQFGSVGTGFKPEWVADFLQNFKDGSKMWLSFSGNEQPWSIDLSGSREVTTVFETCIGVLKSKRPTQPYTSQPKQPTQPFDGNGNATQPFERKPVLQNGKERSA